MGTGTPELGVLKIHLRFSQVESRIPFAFLGRYLTILAPHSELKRK